jgi:hypothetical protein
MTGGTGTPLGIGGSGLLWVSVRMTVFPRSTTDVGRLMTVILTVCALP